MTHPVLRKEVNEALNSSQHTENRDAYAGRLSSKNLLSQLVWDRTEPVSSCPPA
jgi:hypothetical protein